jgi:hypothetical protein
VRCFGLISALSGLTNVPHFTGSAGSAKSSEFFCGENDTACGQLDIGVGATRLFCATTADLLK